MNLKDLVGFLRTKKNEVVDELTCEDLAWDDDTTLSVELSIGELDQIVEILSAYADAVEDEDWEEVDEDEIDDEEDDDFDDEE